MTAWYLGAPMQALLSVIRKGEAGAAGYDADYRNDDRWPLTTQTFDQVRALGRSQVTTGGRTGGRERSSAVGAYQFLSATLDGLKAKLRLSGAEIFDAALQDDLAVALMNGRGFLRYLRGEITAEAFANALAREWASLPVVTAVQGAKRPVQPGQSYYAGDGLNRASHAPEAVLAAVRGLKALPMPGAAPAPSPIAPASPVAEGGDPPWMDIARSYDGTLEVSGSRDNPTIVDFFRRVTGKAEPDAVAWCAAFVGSCLIEAGYPSTGKLNARSYLDYGTKLEAPVPGAIVVFWRESPSSWQGHVAFYVADAGDRILVRGGNQSDSVSVAAWPKSRVLGWRWPPGAPAAAASGSHNPLCLRNLAMCCDSVPNGPSNMPDKDSCSPIPPSSLRSQGSISSPRPGEEARQPDDPVPEVGLARLPPDDPGPAVEADLERPAANPASAGFLDALRAFLAAIGRFLAGG